MLDKTVEHVYGGIIAEIGIGTGNLAKCILKNAKEQGKTVEYIGIDQSVNMLKEAKQKLEAGIYAKLQEEK